MLRYLIRRIAWAALTIYLTVTLVFFVTAALPGDPARTILGNSATPASVAALRDRLGLDRPLLVQYVDWLTSLLRGDFGSSTAGEQSVWGLIGPRLVDSTALVVIAAAIAVPLSAVLGVLTAARRASFVDSSVSVVMLVIVALPEFVVAIAAIYLLAGGVATVLPAVSTTFPGESIFSRPEVLGLPVITAVVVITPYLTRMIRAVMLEVLDSEYVEMARLSGLAPRRVLFRHALPNAIAPFTQVTALVLVYLLGGVVIIEAVFAYPGIGSGLVQAVANRDLPQVQGIAVILVTIAVLIYLVADLLAVMSSPRARTELA